MDRFVVGTGRCGSTLFSRMLAECPVVCSIFEFFNGLDFARRFAEGPVTGDALDALLSAEQPVVNEMLRRGYRVPEITYPFGAAGRYTTRDPLPWLLVSLLPRLGDDPDALYDAMREWARARPPAALADHYRAFFEWLCARSGRPLWIERSGSSVEYLESLVRMFPDARFLHLHRDGPEAALSMREHHAYRLAVTMLYPPEERGAAAPAAEAAGDALDRILATRPPVALFGRYWSEQVTRGARALKRMRPEQYLELAFEDLLAGTGPSLARAAEFLGLPIEADWIARAAKLVHGAPVTRFHALAPDEARELAAVCRPGMQVLGRVA